MNLVESIMTKNPCYTAGKTITVKGLMLHSIGCAQPSASVFIKNWNKASYKSACVHAFIDGNDGTVYQTLPWNHRGWHCGKGTSGSTANDTHIGVEMCEPGCISYTSGSSFTCSDTETAKAVAKRTYEAAVELFAYLCEEYSLDPTADGVIISHAEGYSRGVASNHADPAHLWNGLGLSYTMDTFRKAVKAAMGSTTTSSSSSSAESSGSSSSDTTISASSLPDVPFTVKVLVSDLNYRDKPSMSGTVKGQTGKGTFTITEVSGGWGKLKSGAGWIYLLNTSYCTVGSTVSDSTSQTDSSDSSVPYKVKVTITDLNIRVGPGTNYAKTGKQTGKGTFTIVEESEGEGSTKGWGLLKAYQAKKNGWISLEHVTKL
ncbi:MAG: peptidoglycan recognition protein family protein [Clostridiales bacterium]|nr:peptidoglycan recognition protein family protein [Clostridiales bacterium]